MGFLPVLFFIAVGPGHSGAIRKENTMKTSPLTEAKDYLQAAEAELRELTNKLHSTYRVLTLHAIDLQTLTHEALQFLRDLDCVASNNVTNNKQ